MSASLGIAWRWSQLFLALVVLVIEWILREVITLFFRIIPVPWRTEWEDPKHAEDPNCERGTLEYVEAKGYRTEEHFVTTPDGYILGLHRIPAPSSHTISKDGADDEGKAGVGASQQPLPLRPVLIIHGFMHSSEAVTIRQRESDSLPLVLREAGYDVWLGNNRGNKYSHKHIHKRPTDDEFWDFSMDDMARYDLPTMIECVLSRTGAPSLTLIGFSQGTAQAFAYLSSHMTTKVNLFIALAPVIVPRGFANSVVDAVARARPDFIFLLFGKRQLLPFTLFWRNNLPRSKFVQLIDLSVKFLFGWDTACLAENEKTLLYSHIYSHASVKTLVQWFQIIQTGKFQMFDDYKSSNVSSGSGSDRYLGYVLPQYQLGQIRTPVACFCGGRDTLPHTDDIIDAIPKDKRALVHMEPKYEHLDFMWARDVSTRIYPKVKTLLSKYNSGKEEDSCEL